MTYQTMSAAELVAALDAVGAVPDPELIRTCLARADEVRPGLITRLERAMRQPAPEDDMLQSEGEMHAAQLLIALREPAALPYLENAFRDEEREWRLETFSLSVPTFGPLAVPFLIRVAHDASVFAFGRSAAAEALGTIGQRHPGERQRVLEALRALLPRLDEVDAHPDEMWSWAVLGLAELHDTESKSLVAALDERGMLDSFLLGAGEDLLADFDEGAESELTAPPYDLLHDYEEAFARAQQKRSSPPAEAAIPRAVASKAASAPGRVGPTVPRDPVVRSGPKVGANDQCPCGSGKKFKKCCGR